MTVVQTYWLVAKYIPDLRRREPINVGVILITGERRSSRFLGQRDDGGIDGRRARRVASLPNYKAWVEFWRHTIQELAGEELIATLTRPRPHSNYIVEMSGSRLFGEATESLIDDLFGILVDDSYDELAPSLAKTSENLFRELDIDGRLEYDVKLKATAGDAVDSISFAYRFNNGQSSFMQPVPLAASGERSWQIVHAAAWSFSRLPDAVDGPFQAIALIRPREADGDVNEQVKLLGQKATVVDVSDATRAKAKLASLLHVGGGMA